MGKTKKELEEKVELLSTMLEKKGVLTQSEWKKYVKKNIRSGKYCTSDPMVNMR